MNYNMLKKWPIWLFVLLYLSFYALLIYLIPSFFENEYIIEFSFRIITGILVVFGGISASLLSIFLFKNSIEDGTELLVITKGIKRKYLILIKIFNLVIWILIIAGLTCLLSIGSIYIEYDTFDLSQSIVLGSFIGTIIVYMFWSSITLVSCMLIKSNLVLLLIIGFNFVLYMLSAISIFANGYWFSSMKKYDIQPTNFALMSEVNKTNKTVKYYEGAITVKNDWFPVTKNTIIDNKLMLFEMKDLSNFNQETINYFIKKTNNYLLGCIDWNSQLSSLYTYYSKSLNNQNNLNRLFSVLERDKETSKVYKVNYSKVNLDQVRNWLGTNLLEFSPTNQEYYLALNQYIEMDYFGNSDRVKSTRCFENNFGTIQSKINFDYIQTPILELDKSSNNWKIKTFNDVNEFGEYWFNQQAQNVADFIGISFENENNKFYWPNNETLYFSLLSSYLVTLNNLTSKESHQTIKEKLVNPLMIWSFQFQYWTYMFLQNYLANPEQFKWMDEYKFNLLLSILKIYNFNKPNSFYLKHKFTIYKGQTSEFIQEMELKSQR